MSNTVQPIKDLKLIEAMKQGLLKRSYRDYAIFSFGINCGLRISDILPLKVGDIKNKTHINIREEKTNKEKSFPITPTMRELLEPLMELKTDDTYVFRSKRGENNKLDRTMVYKIINEVAAQVGIKEKIGTHTLRKTFGYWHYKKFKDVAILQRIFNHAAPSVTMRYIGVTQEEIDDSYMNFSL